LLGIGGLNSRAANHLWNGNTSQFWSAAGNWTNGAPAAGDNLLFTQNTLQRFPVNDYANGTVFGQLTLASANNFSYTLSGSSILLTNGIATSGSALSFAPQVLCDLKLGADQTFTSGRALVVSNLDLNGYQLGTAGAGSITIAGNLINSGSNPGSSSGAVAKANTGVFYIAPGATFQVAEEIVGNIIVFVYPSMYVASGTLRVDGAATNVYGSVDMQMGPGTSLTGTGVVDQVECIQASSFISPGNFGPGILQCTTISGSAYSLLLDINGLTPGTDYDQLVSTALMPSYALNVTLGYEPLLGDSFLVVRKPVSDGAPTTFGDLVETTNGYSFGYSTTANGIALTTVRRSDSPFVVWRGAVSAAWSQSNNWSIAVAPASGGRVLFTDYGAFHSSVSNDLPGGSSLASMEFSGKGYSLFGNALTVTEGITNSVNNGTNSILLDLVTAGPLVFDAATGGTMVFTKSFNGSGALHKTGGGTLICSGTTFNSFVGTVAVDAGKLQVDGSFLDGSFTVNGGTLNGTGTVSSVTVNAGTLSPGGSPGVLHIQGNLAMSPGAAMQVELNGPVAGSSYDQLQVVGTVNLNGATLNLQPGFAATVGNAFLILVNDGTDAITGTFAGLPEGATFSAGGQYFSISYQAGTGNDVVLTRVNPPGQLSSVVPLGPGAIQLKGIGGSNFTYTIQANTNLSTTNWVNIGSAPADGSGNFFFNYSNVNLYPRQFFRAAAP
jgi:hypothetical protein